MFRKLFEPYRSERFEVKNRIRMAPIGVGLGTPNGCVTDRMTAFWAARADGGVGLISFPVQAMPGATWGPPGNLGLARDDQIPDASAVVRAIHDHGAKVALSISHPGRRQGERNPDIVPVAPSAIKDPLVGIVPKELSRDEIKHLVDLWAQAARRVRASGADVVTVQACHGYLIHQFLSKRTNRRTDEYGGSLERRARFACEVIEGVRREVGPDFPIFIRMNGDDHFEGGITVEEAIEHARFFQDAGVDGIDVSSGPRESHHWQFLTIYHSSGAIVGAAAAIKKAVRVPITAVGKIDAPLAEKILEEGMADFVALGRPLVADPDWPRKVREGRLEDIRPCIYCNKCLQQLKSDARQICAVNPVSGAEFEQKVQASPVRKKVMVIGGGLAGMEAARTLAERGHRVSLYEKDRALGGQWNIVSSFRPDLSGLVRFLSRGLKRTSVDVFLDREVTPGLVQEEKPDAVVVATGAKPTVPDLQGAARSNVVLATDVLMKSVEVGREVVVVGGGLVGLDVALLLAEQGKKVSVVEEFRIGWKVGSNEKMTLKEKLIGQGAYLYPDSVAESITENGVLVINDGEYMFLKAVTVVIAVGSKSENRLAEQLRGVMAEVYTIGDCVEPRSVLEAIHEGAAVGRAI